GEWLYLALAGSAGYVFKGRYHEGRWVWHGSIASAGTAVAWMTVADATYRHLWLGPTASDYTPKRARLPRGNPLFDANALYRQLSHLSFGRYTGNVREVQKAARRLALQTENLGVGDRQIAVQWTADEGGEHAAVAVTASPEGQVDFKFTADAVGAGLTLFNRLQLHLQLQSGATPGTGYSTPAVLRGAVLRSLLRPKRRWRFEFTVRLADGAALMGGAADPAQTRRSVRSLLEGMARQATPVQLEDREGAVWWVVIESYDEVELRDHPPGRLGRFESGARLTAIWTPDAVDAPE
ncbi:MAG: hypothetical protein NTZ05_03520, partial [Chloroflexi bacterium]|nr:hypothetical protein [Chloroflexota bacterium]